jgi:hypothetical protein
MKKLDGLVFLAFCITISVLCFSACKPPDSESEGSDDATLAFLSISCAPYGELTASFDPDVTSYDLNVWNSLDCISASFAASHERATIELNGASTSSGQTVEIALLEGSNTLSAQVTAENGVATRNYVVHVTRAVSSPTNAELALYITSCDPTHPVYPAPDANSISVEYSTSSFWLMPYAQDLSASIEINDEVVAHGSTWNIPGLNPGDNHMSIVVTGGDGATTHAYAVTVKRPIPSSNAKLSSLTLSSGTLNPGFQPNIHAYTVDVSSSVSSVFLIATAEDENALIKVNGSVLDSGAQSESIGLSVGVNSISILISAQDGVTTASYDLTVNRATPSSNANLSNLSPSVGTLDPAFSSATSGYTVNVANSVNIIRFIPVAAELTSTITVNGELVSSGSQSAPISLNVGVNSVIILVTAEDGATSRTYAISVKRAAPTWAISGTISNAGSGAIGAGCPLVVWWNKEYSSDHGTAVYTSGSFPRQFTLPGLQNGRYFVGAFLDKDNDQEFSSADLFGQSSSPVLVNNANVTSITFTLKERTEEELNFWLSNIPAQYNWLNVYCGVLRPLDELVVDQWVGFGYAGILYGSCAGQAMYLSPSPSDFPGGTYIVYLFVDVYNIFPYPPSAGDYNDIHPYAGCLVGEAMAMVDGEVVIYFDFNDLHEY